MNVGKIDSQNLRTNMVSFSQPKINANKFVQKISGNENFVNSLSQGDSFIDNSDGFMNLDIEDEPEELQLRFDAFDDQNIQLNEPPKSKTKANKFVQQLNTVSSNQTNTVTSTVNTIGSNKLGLPKVGIKDINKFTLKKKFTEKVNSQIKNPNLVNLLLSRFETELPKIDTSRLKLNKGSKSENDILLNMLLNQLLGEIINDIIAKADLLESMLDFSFIDPSESVIDLFKKFREIITKLDLDLREIVELIESKKLKLNFNFELKVNENSEFEKALVVS